MFEDMMPPPRGLSGDPAADRSRLRGLLGRLPESGGPVTGTLLRTEDRGTHTLEVFTLDLNGLQPVPAYFIKPNTPMPKDGYPLVVFNHSHGGRYKVGKDEVFEPAPYMLPHPYADELTGAGYAVIAIDHWAFGERAVATESAIFKEMLWRGMVMWGMMVHDSIRAVDYAIQRPDVDSGRIGTVGMSMGSTMAWWLAALDERVKACVDICCLTDFDHLMGNRGLDLHGIFYYVPNLLSEFSTADINALISPRPHLSVNGTLDPLTPYEGMLRIDAELKAVYERAGVPGNWHLECWEVAHQETQGMRSMIMEFLKGTLAGG